VPSVVQTFCRGSRAGCATSKRQATRLPPQPYNIRVIRVIRGWCHKEKAPRGLSPLGANSLLNHSGKNGSNLLAVGKWVLGVKEGNCVPCRSHVEVCKGVGHRGESLIFQMEIP
jgi:hypothetical protein